MGRRRRGGRLEAAADWFAADAAAHELAIDLAVHDDRARIEQMARQVVDHRAFWDHGGHRGAEQHQVVAHAFPELVEEHTRWRVVSRALHIDRAERKPVREAGWAV